jgi:hypothetical protein
LIALHDLLFVISLFALQFRNHCYLSPISLVTLKRNLKVIFGEDKKSMSGDYFFVLVTLIHSLLKTGLILPRARAIVAFFFLYNMFLFSKKNKIKLGRRWKNFISSLLGISDIACVFA